MLAVHCSAAMPQSCRVLRPCFHMTTRRSKRVRRPTLAAIVTTQSAPYHVQWDSQDTFNAS
jgi:hypothetical protein